MSSRVALLTSGGDTPGMNAAINGAYDQIKAHGGQTLGVRFGFAGLAKRDAHSITADEARSHLGRSGTWLGSSRWPDMRSDAGVKSCVNALSDLKVDGLIVLGGDGSLQAACRLAAHFSPIAFLPCTIDNDIVGTPMTIGMDSAVNYAVDVLERLRCTGRSLPGRGFLVETLGGSSGNLADAVAHKAVISDVLVPERRTDLGDIAERFRQLAPTGAAIAVMSEGYGDAVSISGELTRLSGVRVRPTILGHAQRAADPTRLDRTLARRAAEAAVDELASGDSTFISLGDAGAITAAPLLSTRDQLVPISKTHYQREPA